MRTGRSFLVINFVEELNFLFENTNILKKDVVTVVTQNLDFQWQIFK